MLYLCNRHMFQLSSDTFIRQLHFTKMIRKPGHLQTKF